MADTLAYTQDNQPDTVPDEKVNLTTTSFNPLPDPVLDQRAGRADFALGDKSPGHQVLKDAFASGQEPQVRQQAALGANADFQQDKLNHIKAAVQQGSPLTDTDINGIMAVGTTPEANPDTVFEDKFAKNVVNAGVIGDPSTNLVFQSAFDANPQGASEGIQTATAAVSRKQQATGLLEEAQVAHDNLPWINTDETKTDQQDKLGDLFKTVLSGGMAQYANQRNLMNSAPTNSFLPGSNKLEQVQYLWLLPHDQFLPALRAAAGPGSDLWKTSPSDALDFIKSAVQFSTSDSYADNVMGVANVAGVLPLGTALKGIAYLRSGIRIRPVAEAAKVAIDASQVTSAEDVARGVLSASPKAPTSLLSSGSATGQDGINAASNAMDILSSSSKPPEAGYYVPKAAVVKQDFTASKTAPPTVARNITTTAGTDGVPHVFNEDGVEVQLKRTPEEGHLPVSVETSPEKTTFRTSRGSTYEVHDDGTTTRNRAEGKGNPESTTQADTGNGGLQPRSEKTIYVSGEDINKLAPHQEKDVGRRSLVQDDKGKWGVLQVDGEKAGKFVSKKVLGQPEPAKGLYPVEISDDGDTVHFGNKIVSVEKNSDKKVTFGPEIKPQSDVEARVALADIIKSQAETNPQDVLSKMGQHEEAAKVGASKRLDDQLGQVTYENDVEEIRRRIPSIGSPQLYWSNASSLTRERADRLAQQAVLSSAKLQQAVVDPQRVERLTEQAKNEGLAIAQKAVREKYNRNADAILDQINHWDSQTNLYSVETRFGKMDGTLFDNRATAEFARTLQYRLGSAAQVRQEGNQFYLSHLQHIDETQTGVRNSLIVSGNETPRGWWNSLLTAVTGKFAPLGNNIRSSAGLLSPFQMNNRIAATHAPSIMKNAIEDVAKDIQKMGGSWTTKERQEMQTILEHNRDYMSPDGVRGQFYKSASEFETAFNNRFGYLPSEKQIVAYDQFTRLSDLDWYLRETDLMRDKARLGVRNYKVNFTGKDELGMPANVTTDWFNGKVVQDFDPKITPNANVYVMPEGKFTTKYDLKKGDASSQLINDKLKSGEYQIIQMYNPREKPLMATTGIKDDIHFAIVDKYQDREIRLGENVPYRPGGHVIYQDQHYLKQPKIGPGTNGEITHFGDTTIKAFSTEREANQWADKYNIVRNLIRTNDEAGLRSYMAAGNLPETLPQIKQMFSDGTLSLDHPIVHTFSGRDTLQSNEALARAYPGLKDQFSAYNMSQVQGGDFLADRGAQLDTVKNSGTEANPIYTNVPSRLFDPYTSLQKGLAQVVRERWMGDYKISAAESWVQEFGMLFDQGKLPIEKLRQNPTYWLYHATGNIDAGVMKTNPELVTAAMTARKNIMNFIGSRDEVGSLLDGLQKKVIDKIAAFSPSLARKTEETFLPAITSAPAYARSAAFNAVIGMFNPVQLFQQAQGLVHVYALAPLHAWEATTASALVRLYRHTENADILASAADKAAAMGWNRDHFLEALDGWKRSGTHTIGGETALLSTTADPQLFKNGLSTFLDKGQMFFKAGESVVRDTSWFTAYREWKAANPDKVLDNRELGNIGNRFQVLSLDMTRASNSALNEGILSVPTQFWTWNARFTEQMVTSRLTLAEKARAFTAYSAMYGIPATLGGISFGMPNPISWALGLPNTNYGDIKEYALANNINLSSKGMQMVMEGIPTMILNALTGHETSLQRFGPNATQLKDILDGKKSALETLGGASGSFVAQVMKTVYPAMMYGFSAMKKDSGFPLKWNDLTNLAENISSFNNAEKSIVAWNTGQYISKTEGLLAGDVDRWESFALSLGLNPQRVNDAYTGIDYLKHLKSAQDSLAKKINEDWTLAMKAGNRGDFQTMTDYMTRVQSWTAMGNFTKAQEVENFKRAMHGNESLVDSVQRRMLQDAPNLQSIPAYRQYIENHH